MATLNDVRVLLQAGGRGERLRPDTDTVPKPLLPVGGVPMVERLFRQLLLAGAADFTVVGVLVEVPVMLSLVAIANRTRHWFPASDSA